MVIKARQMGRYVMVSLWCEYLLTNTRFREELPNDSGRPLNFCNFIDKKSRMASAKKPCLFLFCFVVCFALFFV